jgi:uncharacterized protein (DUF1501 family)
MSIQSRKNRREFLKGAACMMAAGGMSSFVPKMQLMGTALAQGTLPGYKALVCLYLNGGNDSWNLLVPTGTQASGQYSHASYVTARNGLYTTTNTNGLGIPRVATANALPPALALTRGTNIPGNLGVNPFAPGLANLYNAGRLAFLANVGTLAEPITRATYNNRRKPVQLYSHNDQTNLWQIGNGGGNPSQAQGFGGQIAGFTAAASSGLSPAISISGQTRFLVGRTLQNAAVLPFQLSSNSNATPPTQPSPVLNNYNTASSTLGEAQRRQALEELFAATYPEFSGEYRDIFDRSLDLSAQLNSLVSALPASGNTVPFPTGNSLAGQLREVARMIRVSKSTLAANRQVYFVSLGGFDTHDNQITSPTQALGHHLLLQRVSEAVNWFMAEMATPVVNASSEVTLFSISDFARTINSNGNGTDHAWGSVQFVAGGAVAGGEVYGRYPAIQLDNRLGAATAADAAQGECFNRGQFLPTTSIDQMAATLARWMGVSDAQLPDIFPNIDRFATGPFANATDSPTFARFGRTIPFLPIA